MPRLLHIDHEQRRVWIAGRRLHHGLTGMCLTVVGVLLMVHDWKDRNEWMKGR